MKRLITIVILFIFVLIFKYFTDRIIPWCGCEFRLEKDYKTSVSTKEEALHLFNDYFHTKVAYTPEEITITENEFIAKGRGLKVDRNGKLYAMYCVGGALLRCIWQLITKTKPY
jgi:hypothetical protein